LSKLKNESWKWKPINRKKRKKMKIKHQKIKTARLGKKK